MMQKFYHEFDFFKKTNICILPPNSNISEIITSANLLITDYSSICADFYYLRKPILFYHFDRDLYIEKINSEIDLKNTLYGEICLDVDCLVDKIMQQSTSPYISLSQIHGEQFFSYFHDRNNCERIYNAIHGRLNRRNP
jgi:CDP-glycerol glycerophosphotransferase (TagB/SpsB family)